MARQGTGFFDLAHETTHDGTRLARERAAAAQRAGEASEKAAQAQPALFEAAEQWYCRQRRRLVAPRQLALF
jgi:hypothetical protein